MRKLASLSIAIVASFALAGAASATVLASIVGSTAPGTNTYSIVMTYAAGDLIQGYAMSVDTTGTYTGVFTRPAVAPFGTFAGAVVLNPPTTGIGSRWAAVSGGPNGPGGTFTIGTVEITVVAGDTIKPIFVGIDGFLVGGTTTVVPSAGNITGVTVIPEPTTGALLGLGIVGLVVAGRRSRA